jgi:hypothetical protein
MRVLPPVELEEDNPEESLDAFDVEEDSGRREKLVESLPIIPH